MPVPALRDPLTGVNPSSGVRFACPEPDLEVAFLPCCTAVAGVSSPPSSSAAFAAPLLRRVAGLRGICDDPASAGEPNRDWTPDFALADAVPTATAAPRLLGAAFGAVPRLAGPVNIAAPAEMDRLLCRPVRVVSTPGSDAGDTASGDVSPDRRAGLLVLLRVALLCSGAPVVLGTSGTAASESDTLLFFDTLDSSPAASISDCGFNSRVLFRPDLSPCDRAALPSTRSSTAAGAEPVGLYRPRPFRAL